VGNREQQQHKTAQLRNNHITHTGTLIHTYSQSGFQPKNNNKVKRYLKNSNFSEFSKPLSSLKLCSTFIRPNIYTIFAL